MNFTIRLTALAALSALLWACAEEVPVPVQENAGASGSGGGGSGGGSFFEDEDPPLTSGAGGSGGDTCGPPVQNAECGAETFAGKSLPLDIYIVFDQSASMCACLDQGTGQLCVDPCNTTRLDAVRTAIEDFSVDPANEGIGVGLGLFGQQQIGQTSCDVAEYDTPVVDVGSLPDQASALSAALAELEPVGETPTGSALRGACGYARDYRATVPDHQVVLLLLTDGRPEAPSTCRGGAGECCPSLDDAVQAADECRNTTGIRTFVIGVGPLLDNLEQIAVAGGSEQAYLVQSGDVGAQVRDALNRIRGAAAIPCELALPEPPVGETLAFNNVNLDYEGAECQQTPFSAVTSADDCGDEDGWHYDDPSAPQRVLLCPRSCDRVSGPGGHLYFSVGCETRLR